MSNKTTITELMADIDEHVKKLKELIEEDKLLTPNKIWLPGKGIVTLWETQNNGR